ncbi:RPA-related protein RADX [Tenrec ecaudatus]|uniref:RPA-related protein RADX n=1 Tax=Tenrec ecaudatus TaxID=94439 RepID=UPI003F5940D6
MSSDSSQSSSGSSHAGSDQEKRERERNGVTEGVTQRCKTLEPRSWIQKVLEQAIDTPRRWINLLDVQPVAVLAIQRYLLEDDPREGLSRLTNYCFDVTISDGVYQEKCFLDPNLNFLVYNNILKAGKEVIISRISCLYNEKRVGQGILWIAKLLCGGNMEAISVEIPFRNRAQKLKPERPLRGVKSHYLALWNNEDPYGDIWLTNKQAEEINVKSMKIISLSNLEMTWSSRCYFPALLVRILHKSKLRYYGKPNKNIIEPYQAFLDVADSSGMVSVVMWNSLCPEWYKSLNVGSVLLLQDYSVKQSYPIKKPLIRVDAQMKLISTIEICLNLQDPQTNIHMIPEKQVKSQWGLPKLTHQFITRAELNDLPDKYLCDIVGILVYVGRVQRLRKKEKREDFWTFRWLHAIDQTSQQPFIVKLFSTSQPDIFENLYPMTYFICTQLKVMKNSDQEPKLLYLITTNNSRISVTDPKDQPCAHDAKVKNFIHWVKGKRWSEEMKNTVFGGYYPYPPVPETFSKYSSSVKVESLLIAISEVRKTIENLQYREQKRIAIQGIITVIRYFPHRGAPQSTSASETLQHANLPSRAARGDSESRESGHGYYYRNGEPVSPWSSHSASTIVSLSKRMRAQKDADARLITVPQPETSSKAKGNKAGQESTSNNSSEKYRKFVSDKWESPLWREMKSHLIAHLHYSYVYPESIPRNFVSQHKHFLSQQYNLQSSIYSPPEEGCPPFKNIKAASNLGHFEVTILGLNHEIAIDVAFMPMYCSKDVHESQIDKLLSSMNYSCVFPPEATDDKTDNQRVLAGDIIKAVTELNKAHVISILDICNLGDNKIEVCLHKIYTPENIYE